MDAAAELFWGTWRYEAQMDNGSPWNDYLHFSTQGLALRAFSIPYGTRMRHTKPQALWFKVEPPCTLHFGHPQSDPGWTRQYRFENDDRFLMSHGDQSWTHHRMAVEEVPDWVVTAIDAALKE